MLQERREWQRLGEEVRGIVRGVDVLDAHDALVGELAHLEALCRHVDRRERWHDLRSRDSSTAPELST